MTGSRRITYVLLVGKQFVAWAGNEVGAFDFALCAIEWSARHDIDRRKGHWYRLAKAPKHQA